MIRLAALRGALPLVLGIALALLPPGAPAFAQDLQEQDAPAPEPPEPPDPPSGSQPAQPTQPSTPLLRRFEVSVGGGLFQGWSLGSADADLRDSSPVPRDFQLFATTTRLTSAPFLEVGLGTALTRRIGIEGRVSAGRPSLRTRVSGDAEGVPSVTVSEGIERWVIEGSVSWSFDERQVGPVLFVPFVMAGGGYLRQLYDGRSLVEEGQLYHAGAGLRHWLFTMPKGAIRAAGVRADGRVYIVNGGDVLDEAVRVRAAIAGAFFMVF